MKNLLSVPVVILAASAVAGEYVVGYGDTLWDISNWFYGTPEKWEDILQANPELQGVEYLVPGMTLYIPQYGSSAASAPSGIPGGAVVIRSSEPILSRLQQESSGFVIYTPLNSIGYIIATNAEEEGIYRRLTALPGDMLEIDAGSSEGVEEGQIFHLVREGEEVTDPESGRKGTIYRTSGVCSVVETTPETSIAYLEHAYLPVKEGDAVIPYHPASDIRVNNAATEEQLVLQVLGLRNSDRTCAYNYDVVYLSGGARQGISPGDVFTFYSRGEQLRDSDDQWITTADIPTADLVILTTEEESCAALVVANATPDLIETGDLLYLTSSQTD